MLDRVLTAVKSKDYIAKFNELVKTSSLTDEKLKDMLAQKAILGFLSHYDIHDYEDILSFEMPQRIEEESLLANHIAGKYGLAIGKKRISYDKKSCDLEILQLKHIGSNFYCDLPSVDVQEHSWLQIPREFRLETHELLPSRSKNRFKNLIGVEYGISR